MLFPEERFKQEIFVSKPSTTQRKVYDALNNRYLEESRSGRCNQDIFFLDKKGK